MTWPRRRPIRPFSRKRRRRQTVRTELLARAIPTTCPMCGLRAADQTHETVNRSQRTGVEVELIFMEPVCHICHDWIGKHREEAHDRGMVLWSYEADDEEAVRAAQQARLDWEMYGRPR